MSLLTETGNTKDDLRLPTDEALLNQVSTFSLCFAWFWSWLGQYTWMSFMMWSLIVYDWFIILKFVWECTSFEAKSLEKEGFMKTWLTTCINNQDWDCESITFWNWNLEEVRKSISCQSLKKKNLKLFLLHSLFLDANYPTGVKYFKLVITISTTQ